MMGKDDRGAEKRREVLSVLVAKAIDDSRWLCYL